MARIELIIEIRVPPSCMYGDVQINQFAGTELQEKSFIVDYLKEPQILSRHTKKDSVVLVFGTADKEKLPEIKSHPRVLGINTDSNQCAKFSSKKT